MWLVDADDVWDALPGEKLRSTELALGLLARMRVLLGAGEHWRSESLATTWKGEACDPLSERAYFFSLGGAAARARWEMREELADAEISPVHVKQVMNAIFAVAREYRGDVGGWTFAEAILDGMRHALEEYRAEQAADLEQQQDAA